MANLSSPPPCSNAAWICWSAVPTRNRKVDFGAAQTHLGPDDALFVWKKPQRRSKLLTPEQWAQLPAQLTVRLVRVHWERPGFRSAPLCS